MHRITVQRWLRKEGKVRANPPRSERYARVVELFERGWSCPEIAEEVKLHTATVKKWLKSVGKYEAKPPSSDRYSHISVAKVVGLHDLGMNNRKISKEFDMTPSTVGNWLRKAGKTAPKAVTAEQLQEARLDPAWAARHGIRNRVVCLECGALRSSLNDSRCNHLREHRMTTHEYKNKYPGAPLHSFDIEASHLRWEYRHRSVPSKTADELMTQFADKYLPATEHNEYLEDSEWEKHHGIKDFVACKLCGFKCEFRLSDHLKSIHSMSSAAYLVRFPKSPLLPLNKKNSERDRSRTKARALRALANIGRAIKRSDDAAKVVGYLVRHRHASNAETREATNAPFSDRYLTELRTQCKVPAPTGRPKARAQTRTPSGRFHRQ
jgi:transposase